MQLLPNGQDVASLYFGYSPNLPLTYVGMVLFGLLFLGFCTRIFLSHSRLFLLLLPLTSLLQVVGYALRYECAINPSMGLFTAMSIFLLLCANVIALVNYKTVREIIIYSGAETRYIVIGPRFAKIFFEFNIIASVLQGVGGGIQSDPDNRAVGSHLTIAGSCIQIATLICFLIAARYVHRSDDYHFHVHGKDPKRKLFTVIYITTLLLCIRLVYRIASSAMGIKGVIATHEWTYYVFDTLMLVLCLFFHLVFFIGNYLPHVNEVIDEENYGKEGLEGQIDLKNINNNDSAQYQQSHQSAPYNVNSSNNQQTSNGNAEPSTIERLISVLPVTRVIYRIAKKA
ncbi:RTA1-domain-containing protein [Mucor ambiguus]|uniref:RTA1-domain-containing protein n=1 Tax=Mucor ambiguus TaxID=91626 RepID=A0A0C9M9Y6_9FUNG|nr:RTA1-domain-containing protein [Mucor ambiguus]